jgi:signal transduction histidine kinase
MVRLFELLQTKHREILCEWESRLREGIVPGSVGHPELLDHLPRFLTGLAAALREEAGLPPEPASPDPNETAAGHGAQRLRLGFSLDAVVREYGVLYDSIVAIASDEGRTLSMLEFRSLSRQIVAAIALAVTEYSQQRDAEMVRLANEHFAFVAHELRNPISSAMVALQLLKKRGEIRTDNAAVRALERGLLRTTELVDQTLQAARVASGIDLQREPTTLKVLVEEASVAAGVDAEAKDVLLRHWIEQDLRLNLDVRLVRSALGNLIWNGVKYTPPGGVVEVRARVAKARVAIEVEDSCGGLPPGKVEEAFAPFVRLSDRTGGFGLGLAIAKQAVDAHGGSIRVQNLPGKGCIFVMELPIAEGPSSTTRA